MTASSHIQFALGTVVLNIAFALLGGCTPDPQPAAEVKVSAPTGNWTPIFDGKTLEGWTPKIAGLPLGDNYRNTFSVRDGLLRVSYDGYDRFENRFGSLFYAKRLSHYWIRAEYRFVGSLAAGAPRWAYKNSGLQVHSQAPDTMGLAQQFPVSVEFDIKGGWFFGSRPTGDVCQNGTRVMLDLIPLEGQCSTVGRITIRDDQWTTALAEVDGDRRVRHVVNGNLVVEYTDLALDEGNPDARRLIAAGAARTLASGYISIQSNGHPIEFRRIEVLDLDDAAPGR